MDPVIIKEKASRIQNQGLLSDLEQTAEGLGITVVACSFRNPALLGVYLNKLRNRMIYLNDQLHPIQKKMVLAHEIGHDQLHRKLAAQGSFQEYSLTQFKDPTEYEANAFAAQLLIPDSELIELADLGYSVDQTARRLEVAQDLLLIKLKEMQKMGNEIPMSEEPDSLFFRTMRAADIFDKIND